jgi:membrane associated rhomboid family serine protease
MIPLRSSEPHYTKPTVNLFIIGLNVLVFLYERSLGQGYRFTEFIQNFGLVADHFRVATIFTSMFIHGGWLHILGNMWFLWVFGRGVEDVLGHAKYFFFYMLCGVAAAVAQTLINTNSTIPTVGASGAIAGVMGAYLVTFPRARVVTLVFIVIFITTVDIPSAFLLLYWFAIQFFNGVGSIGDSQSANGGVAWFAHVGGFIAGIVLIKLMAPARRARSYY